MRSRETDLGPPVVAWLSDHHWDVYQEVTVDSVRRGNGRITASRVFADYGIGVLSVVGGEVGVNQDSAPAFNRRVFADRVRANLHELHKTFAVAGSSSVQRWTPFRFTCNQLRSHVQAHPGCTVRDAVDAIRHHYASDAGARARIVTLIQRGVIGGVRLNRVGKTWTLTAT